MAANNSGADDYKHDCDDVDDDGGYLGDRGGWEVRKEKVKVSQTIRRRQQYG